MSPSINDAEVQVDLPDSKAAAKPVSSSQDEDESEEKDQTLHYYNHPLETDHPYS